MGKKAMKTLNWPKLLAEIEAGAAVAEIAKREGITSSAIYRQRKQVEAGRSHGVPGRPKKLEGATTRITLRVPEEIVEAARREAAALGIPESELLREALVERFTSKKANPPKKGRG
ncbi:MAG: CopG antitoxin of type toxin-antitoxin system [Candidatus Sumerlaeota bacterium]|nr:CopG antitoxin of type toxin-antitoxin system [Candidatus Sumerlaeota bacterium]